MRRTMARVKSSRVRMVEVPRQWRVRRMRLIQATQAMKMGTKARPATPTRSAIWMRAVLRWRATPRPFQPKPVKIQPRSHSVATQAAAARAAQRRDSRVLAVEVDCRQNIYFYME
jgi:hypothetical protein